MGEHERDLDGPSVVEDDPPTETSLEKPAGLRPAGALEDAVSEADPPGAPASDPAGGSESASAGAGDRADAASDVDTSDPSAGRVAESARANDATPADDYLRPYLPRDVFGSQIGPAANSDEAAENEGLETPPSADDEPSAPPTDPHPEASPAPRSSPAAEPPDIVGATERELDDAIDELQGHGFVSEDAPVFGSITRPVHPLPIPASELSSGEWTEWRALGADAFAEDRTTIETPPKRIEAVQPQTIDYLVLHPFPLRTLAVLVNFGLIMISPWLAATLLDEKVYAPALDVVAEVWFVPYGAVPAALAVLLALWITVRRRRHIRYELGYLTVAWLCAGAAASLAFLSVYEAPSHRGTYLLATWAGLLSLLPLLSSLHVNMDPAWVVGRRRYWTGAAMAVLPLLVTVGLLAGAVSAVHGAYADWRRFMDPEAEVFCQGLFESEGFRPGSLAMAVLGRRRDSQLAGRVADCVQTLVNTPWSDSKAPEGQPLTKAAVQATGDTLSTAWRASQKNVRLAADWEARRARLQELRRFVSGLPDEVQAAFRERLRSKGPARVACENPFRAAEAALWRAAGHPDCGRAMSRSERVKSAFAWMSFMGQGAAFRDPRMNDLRGARSRDFRALLQEVSHTARDRETRTHDVTLVAPVGGVLDRLMIVRVAPNDDGRQRVYAIAYVQETMHDDIFRIVRDDWASGSRLRCVLRPEFRRTAPRGFYRIYALKDANDGFIIVRKWTRGPQRREYYQFTVAKEPC